MPSTRAQIKRRIENSHSGYKHHDTPTKAKVRAACEVLHDEGLRGFHTKVFERYGVSKSQGWELLQEGSAVRRFGHNLHDIETRGRPRAITPEQLRQVERLLEDCDVEGRSMSWETLAYEAGLDVSARTLRRAMGTLDYHKCIACRRGWVSQAAAKRRVEYATVMLDKYPLKQDWYHIRFSDEVHFGLGPQGKLRIIRKPG
jgi:transposase